MKTTYKRLKSVLLRNDKKILVNLKEWGDLTLSGDELDQFQQDFHDMDNYYNEMINRGELEISPLIEEVEVENNMFDLDVGIQLTRDLENTQKHPREDYWFDKMSKDPNVIEFNHDDFEG